MMRWHPGWFRAASPAPHFLREPYKYVVGTWPSPNLMGTPFFKVLVKQEPDIKSAHHIAFDLQFDRNNAAWAKEALAGLGVEWRGDAFYQAGAFRTSRPFYRRPSEPTRT